MYWLMKELANGKKNIIVRFFDKTNIYEVTCNFTYDTTEVSICMWGSDMPFDIFFKTSWKFQI